MTEADKITLRIGPAEVAIDAAVHAELQNWAAWQAARKVGQGRAGSAEGRYRASAPGSTGVSRVDPQRALTIERTVGDPGFPRRSADLLRYQYVLRMDARVSARMLGVAWRDLGWEFQRAVWTVRNRRRG